MFAYTVGVVLVTIFMSVSEATAQAPDKSARPDQFTLQGASRSAVARVASSDPTATPEPSALGSAAGKQSSAQTEWKPSTELCSVDHKYCVKIVAKAQDSDHRELIVSSKTRVLAQFPTFGYLMDAFWSPDNKYVAINNRRANAGDYLWIISLSDGAALKMPDDLATEMGKKNLGHINGYDPWGKTVQEVTTRFTECAHKRLDHEFLFAQGWKGANELLVVEELQFSNEPPQSATITAPGPDGVTRSVTATVGYYGPGAPGIWIAVNKACRITGNKITLKGQTIEKHEHSSEFVNRAWTYGSYWIKSPAEDSFTSAQAKQAKGDLDGAISDYNSAIELDPKNPYAYYNRGLAKAAKGDVEGAVADYNRTIELNPKFPPAYNSRGNVKQAKGDLDGAMADYNRAIELDPEYADAYSNRSKAKQAKGDLDGAKADHNRAEQPSESLTPNKLCSTDSSFCIQIVDTILPDKSVNGRIAADYPEQEDRTLVVFANGPIAAQYPTYGFLLSAFWSPDNTHVAINNRRANAGDYLGILSLPDGGAIKVPEDVAPKQEREKLAANDRKVMKEITRRFPNCTENTTRKVWLTARGWKSANELMVREDFQFYLKPAVFVTVSETYRLSGNQIERLPFLDIHRVHELRD